MAAKRRHWWKKNERFWARISIRLILRPYFDGKTQLTEALGGDRRIADRNHAAAVARLQEQLEQARLALGRTQPKAHAAIPLSPITKADFDHAVWDHDTKTLQADKRKRASLPTLQEMNAEREAILQRIEAGEIGPHLGTAGMINAYTDFELMLGARDHDGSNRARRLAALRSALATGDMRLVEPTVRQFTADNNLGAEPQSPEWQDLAHRMLRAEIEALERTVERDRGYFSGQPTDPIVKTPADPIYGHAPVPLMALFEDYIASRQAIGKHSDGGANWDFAMRAFIAFLGHSDARKITKRNLLDWRDSLMASGKAAKTVSDKYLAAIRAVLRWAFENERLPTNEAATLQQEVPRKVLGRERVYTTPEAIRILKTSLGYQPAAASNPSHRESAPITAAKRWMPLLCAFTGARPTELAQLRKEDVRCEENRWILRITPAAGSVKSGQYRDVPLHRQVVALGFVKFVATAKDGPLFHGVRTPVRYHAAAMVTSGRISEWLNDLGLVPKGIQPSYAWRHRFKTLGRELGASDRVLDAIQGHSGKTASDGHGDVTITAKLRVIDALSDYELSDPEPAVKPAA